MARALSEIRRCISATLTARLGDAAIPAPDHGAWRESAYPFDRFPGLMGDTRDVEHHAFAVGILTPTTPMPGPQRPPGFVVETPVGVRWTSRVTGDGALDDYDAALDDEVAIVRAVLDTEPTQAFNIRLTSIATRRVLADVPLYLGEARFLVQHHYPR